MRNVSCHFPHWSPVQKYRNTKQYFRPLHRRPICSDIISQPTERVATLPGVSVWHFVDIPIDAKSYDVARYCKPSLKGDRVVAEIERARFTLADSSRPKDEHVEALKWLVHFVGDIHQPMHGVGEARGANDVHVVEFGSAQCWEIRLQPSRPLGLRFGRTHGTFGSRVRLVPGKTHQRPAPRRIRHTRGLGERVARSRAGGVVVGRGLVDEKYYGQQISVVDERLALAGLRLAAILNGAFAR
jgi:S1/P1 Nuclease